jgi:ATP-binding cassette subfamily C protein/ATP-binding cassette subfamily C protein LapB
MTRSEQFLNSAKVMEEILGPARWLGLDRISDYARGLTYLLAALEWNGQAGQICEALPHMPGEIDQVYLISTMTNLGFHVQSAHIQLDNIDHRLAPCLFIDDTNNDTPLVLTLNDSQTDIEVFNAGDQSISPLKNHKKLVGTIYLFQPLNTERLKKNRITANVPPKSMQWFGHLAGRFKPIILQALLISVFINFLALASSLYIMVVYDKVIGSRSLLTLKYLVFGVLLAIAMEALFRYLRARSLAYFGVRMDAISSTAIFERLLFLPPKLIEGSSIPSQVARIKDFDSIRTFLSGSTGIRVIELPFTVIFIFTIAMIGGPLVLVPLALAVCYTILGLVMMPRIQAYTELGATARVKKQALLVETMKKLRSIKSHGLADAWWERFHTLSGQAAMTSFSTSFLSSIIEAIAHGLSILAGIATLSMGIWLVWNNQITTGALIASMILVWRVLTPMQATCNSLVQIRYIFRSISQVHKLIRTPPESDPHILDSQFTTLKGDVSFENVGLRYTVERGPVISGLSLKIKQGEIIAITGSSGSGKSSLLKLTNGLYSPQMGAILIDGIDIRQRDPVDLRKNISYVPQAAELFHGTIEKNLRMVKPEASDQELAEALKKANAYDTVQSLTKKINTFIGDYRSDQLSSIFTFQLNLARGYLRDGSIMLFDEFPPALLNSKTGELFLEFLVQNKGRKTIFFITDRQKDIMLADKLIYFPGTGSVLAGEPKPLLDALQP